MQEKVFYTICFGFLLGVLLRSFISVNFYFTLWLVGISFLLIFFHFFISKNKWGIITGIFVLTFSLGIFRFNMVDVSNPAIFENQVGQKATFSGEIIDEPSIKENKKNRRISLPIKEKNLIM